VHYLFRYHNGTPSFFTPTSFQVSKEKAELVAKLKAATRPDDAYLPSPGGNGSYSSGNNSSSRPPPSSPPGGSGGGPDSPRAQSAADMARRFNELREEYRMYR